MQSVLPDMKYKWLEVAQELQAIAQEGLTYTEGKFDRIRYERLRNISTEIMAHFSELEMEPILDLWASYTRYPTPKVDVRAAVFEGEKLLLVKEADTNGWAMPGGWADIGFTPTENAVKEVREETGLIVRPVRLIAVWDKKCHPHPPEPDYCYKLAILCEKTGGEIQTSIETTDVQFFGRDEVPPLSTNRNTKAQIFAVFEARDKELPVHLD